MSKKYSHYHFDQQPVKKRAKKKIFLSLAGIFLLITVGVYSFMLTQSPDILLDSSESAKSKENALVSQKKDFIKIDKLNLVVLIEVDQDKAYASGEIIWKNPKTSENNEGGNFVLCATRYKLGITPLTTKERSPFYHIEKLNKNDKVDVYHQGQWYSYKVSDIRNNSPVDPSQINNNNNQAKLAMFTCSKNGDSDGHIAVIGEPIVSQETQKDTKDSGSSLL